MAPENLLKVNGARATKPLSVLSHKMKNTCSCSGDRAREKVQLRFFLRQLINTVGVDALTDMFQGFRIPVPFIRTLFEAEAHTYLISTDGEGSLPKDAQGKPMRTIAPTDFILVKDEVVEDEKKKSKKKVSFATASAPKERIFIDLTGDDDE